MLVAPLWLLKQQFRPGGHRLPKFKELKPDRDSNLETCFACGIKIAIGQAQCYRGGKYYHSYCTKNHRTGFQFTKPEGTGNLADSEYRFWVGIRDKDAWFSKCRACKTDVYGPNARLEHKADKQHHVAGSPCTVQLTNAYRKLLTKKKCIVCRQDTNNSKWGVPLCNNLKCEEAWKFDQSDYLSLRVELMQESKVKE